ncbi:nucleoside 2-deoxyribosyltransferase [Vibrio tasmaniensis 1F-187]|uniref:nucleoside 2-deoxyribosyltransferase n=1 Tax=unclassified Vibrio TaxID=2614977 RepID=UPI0003186DE4|nr:nucleoside 2-deoxyribosyltransferase [Vibrio tasmaniensis]OEF68949.1 nucleoside 2-deoxyribosyltransferase [Vibrio tasmaniensis 1F-187]
MKRIYLAGPEVFLSDAVSIGDQKKKICEAYGFEGIFPLDNIIELNEPSPQQNGLKIGRANEELIKSCDAVIANMTPFRGASCDVGTAYEMGFSKALGKTVLAYTNSTDLFLKRNLEQLPNAQQVDNQSYVDGIGMTLENFGLIDNLMLDNAVSGQIELENVAIFDDQTEVYRNLRAFIRCLEQLKNI